MQTGDHIRYDVTLERVIGHGVAVWRHVGCPPTTGRVVRVDVVNNGRTHQGLYTPTYEFPLLLVRPDGPLPVHWTYVPEGRCALVTFVV